MPARRVAVTGLGVVSALGRGRDAFWTALEGGRSGIAPLVSVGGPRLRFANGAEVRDFDPTDCFTAREAALLDRFAQFGLMAAREAVADAGLQLDAALRPRAAVVMGSCLGGQVSQDAGF